MGQRRGFGGRPQQRFLATLVYSRPNLRTPRACLARQSQSSCPLQAANLVRGEKKKLNVAVMHVQMHERIVHCRNMDRLSSQTRMASCITQKFLKYDEIFQGGKFLESCGGLIFIDWNGHKLSSDCWLFSG